MTRPRLAIVCSHPVQYYAPLFQRLARQGMLDLHVFFGWTGGARVGPGAAHFDPGFGREVEWDVDLLAGYEHSFVPNRSRAPGAHHFRGIDCPDMAARIRAWRPDVLLVFGWAYHTHLALLREFHGKLPILFRGDSTLVDERPGPRRLLRRAILTWVYRHVDRALYVGRHNREYFLAHGLREGQLEWVPHAVDNRRFEAQGSAHAADEARARAGVPREAPCVLFAGKLEVKKAPDVLLESFLRLGDPDAHLVFAGTGPLEQSLRARCRGDARVHFIGFQNQSRMPAVYRMADVLVLPSRGPGESWGLAVNEAMACGCPAVVSDRVGCAPDLVAHGRTGLVVPAENPDALCEALRQLVDDPSLRDAMSDACKATIAGWSIERAAELLEGAVLRALPAPRGRDDRQRRATADSAAGSPAAFTAGAQ